MSAANAEILREAAGLLETEGWVQGKRMGPGGYCLVGAMQEVLRRHYGTLLGRDVGDQYWEISHRLHDLLGVRAIGLPSWNDAAGRRKDEVVDLLQRAAVAEEQEAEAS